MCRLFVCRIEIHTHGCQVASLICHHVLHLSIFRIFLKWWSSGQFFYQTLTLMIATYYTGLQIRVPTWESFLAHLSRRLMGELIVYQSLRRPSVICRPSVNIFKHLLLWNHWANWTPISYGDSLGCGNESLFKWSWSHDQDDRHAYIQAFKRALLFLFFLLFPTFLICFYFSLLFHENALLSLLFNSKMSWTRKIQNFFLAPSARSNFIN